MRVRAEIRSLDELSAHADQKELLEWIKPLAPSLRQVFLVHGEARQSATLAEVLHSTYGTEAVPPSPGQSFYLSAM
jgi:metallo-beta-lactamase family protein